MTTDKEDVAEAYRLHPRLYDLRGMFILWFAYRSSLRAQVSFFSRHMGPRHLEAACGTGSLLQLVLLWRWLTRQPRVQIDAFDYAPRMLEGAKSLLGGRPDVRLLRADAAALPADFTGVFDTVAIANALHCIPAKDVDGAIRGLFGALKPRGVFVANVLLYPRTTSLLDRFSTAINEWGKGKNILVTPYTEEDVLARLKAAGFMIQSHGIKGNCLEVVALKPAT